MLGDREKPAIYAAEQRRLIRTSIDGEVLRYAPGWSDRARAVGLSKPRTVGDLAALDPVPLEQLGRAASLLIRPSIDALGKTGPGPLKRRVRAARLRGRSREIGPKIVDPLFKPIHWLIERDVPFGCSEADLSRLAELGRRMLVAAGIGSGDAIVSVLPSGPNLGYWQLALGARELGAPLAGLHPGTPADPVVLLGPTVLAGRPGDLHALLQRLPAASREGIGTVLAVARAPMPGEHRSMLATAAGPQTTIVEAWAPPGVRALWGQCPGGDGVHTWPTTELVEVCDDRGAPLADQTLEGRIVWTGLGWRGTAVLRLDTGLRGRLEGGPCPACRRTTPRLVPVGVDAPRPKRTIAPTSVRRIEVTEPAAASAIVERPAAPASVEVESFPNPADDVAFDVGERDPDHVLPPLPVLAPIVDDDEDDDDEDEDWPAAVLEEAVGLAAWQAELRLRGDVEELVVHLALEDGVTLGDVLPGLEEHLGATQYVITDATTIEERIVRWDGLQVVERDVL